jgi:biopolymer transport protein TolR
MNTFLSRRALRVHGADDAGGLNIVPYLDIMMNLVMFMLLTMTAFAGLGVVNVTAPKYRPDPLHDGQSLDLDRLILTVAIAKNGFYIGAANRVPSRMTEREESAPTILRKRDYDYFALTAKMVEIKAAFPMETRVVIAADPDIEYQTLVSTIDAVRETKSGDLLFYDVSVAQL